MQSVQCGSLVLLRHGETIWSKSGQHTGHTDIPLTENGIAQAKTAGMRLREAFPDGFNADCVYVSPLKRAQQTLAYTGLGEGTILPEIIEWDYGKAEGRTREDIHQFMPDWDIWDDGPTALPDTMLGEWEAELDGQDSLIVKNGEGENLNEVADRTRKAIELIFPKIKSGNNVLFVAHAHVLRILATQWINADPILARNMRLDTAHYSVLSLYKGDSVIEHWNM
ncbi:MAG: histidine phosphatase family protein [Bifidobacteriaceae bacterium]|nr:histidine phosphatase family protein [Bifidobacteriaceae bacterium]